MSMYEPSAIVKRVIMIKTGEYIDQYNRPFTANVNDGNILNQFVEKTGAGTNITAQNIASVAGQVLQPSSMVSGIAPIIGGWQQTRVRFFIEAEFTNSMGIKHVYLVQGYSDQPGFSASGYIDPNMLLFMNNVVILQENAFVDPNTGMMSRRMIDTSQVIYRPPSAGTTFGASGYIDNRMQTMLPSEIIQNIGTQHLAQIMNSTVYNMTNALDTSPLVKSNRTNAVASRYIERTLNAIGASIADTDVVGAPLMDVTSRAKNYVPEAPLSQDKFISLMTERTPFQENGYIRWGELVAIFPTIENVTICIDRKYQQMVNNANNNIATGAVTSIAYDTTRDIRNLESWTDASRETVVANTLGYAIPAVMMEHFIAGLSFTVTNMNHTGQPTISIHHRDTFLDNMDMTVYLARMTNVILNEIMANVSFNNMHTYNISMNTNILGDTYINIMLNGGVAREYLMPTFCDALTVPVVTHSQFDKDNLSSGILSLSTAVRNNHEYLSSAQHSPFYTSIL